MEAPNLSTDDPPPGVPTRGVILLAFAGVVVAGLLGALAAYGIVDVDCRGGCGTNAELAAVVGALIGTIGGGIVAVLVLRARALWRVPLDDVPQETVPQDDVPQDDVPQDDVPQDDVPQDDGYQNDG